MDNFARCFAFTVAAEGGFTKISFDPGNWTGGAVGHGTLRGTKYGISAAAYPALDIENLSEQDAAEIYRRDYYAPLHGDELGLPVAQVLFDGAVNAGMKRAVTWLQQALGEMADGVLGARTLDAAKAADALGVAREMLARRVDFYARLPGWADFGLGWSRRVIALSAEILR
jgi:lysozyme family protein